MRLLARIILFSGLCLALYLTYPWILTRAGGYFIVSDDDGGPADAVLVLSGDRGLRTATAIRRFLKGNIDWLVLYSTDELLLGSQKRKGEYAREEAIRKGISARQILLPEILHSTFEESQYARHLIGERGWKKIVVVTNAFHTRRARWIFHKVLAGSGCEIRFLASSLAEEKHSLDRWWTREDELIWVFNETVKGALYFFKYRDYAPQPVTN